MPRFVFFVVVVILQVQCQYITWNFNPRMNLFRIICFFSMEFRKKRWWHGFFWVTVWKTTVWTNRNLFIKFIVESSTIQSNQIDRRNFNEYLTHEKNHAIDSVDEKQNKSTTTHALSISYRRNQKPKNNYYKTNQLLVHTLKRHLFSMESPIFQWPKIIYFRI